MLDACGGDDDVVFLVAPGNETELPGGPGADIMALCGLEDGNATIVLDRWAMADPAPDALVLRPRVFERIPEGYERKTVVTPFIPAVDRIYLPPGVGAPELDFHPIDSTLRVGRVMIQLGLPLDRRPGFSAGVTAGLTPDAVRTLPPGADLPTLTGPRELAGPPAVSLDVVSGGRCLSGAPAGLALPRISCDPDRIGIGPPPTEAPGLVRIEPNRLGYGRGEDVIIYRTDRSRPKSWPGHEAQLLAGEGDDRITLFGADTLVNLGPGADIVLACGLGEGLSLLLVSPTDGAPNIVVPTESVFAPTGLPRVSRHVSIGGLGDTVDRLVLQLPPSATITEE